MTRNSKTIANLWAGNRRNSQESIRILLTEGSSLSARQTITALGQCGYTLDVCDPNPLCISRFSRFVRHYFRCPVAGTDPLGYLAFVLHGLSLHHYDVLLPVLEIPLTSSATRGWSSR